MGAAMVVVAQRTTFDPAEPAYVLVSACDETMIV
jgi:hypothetical protein